MHYMLVHLDAIIQIGATGAPSINTGDGYGIQSITRLSAGRYRIQLTDNYAKLLTFQATPRSPVSGSALNVDASHAALSVGTVYKIVTTGTSTQADFVAIGMPAGIVAAPGITFKAAATGAGTGTGTVQTIGYSGIQNTELLTANSGMINNQPYNFPMGGYIDFQCVGATDSSTTTPVATDPANGSTLHLAILLSNSQVQ